MENKTLEKGSLSKDQLVLFDYITKEKGLIIPDEVIRANVSDHIWYLYEKGIDDSISKSRGDCLFKCIICGNIMYNKLENVSNYIISSNPKYNNKNITDIDRLILYKETRREYLSSYTNYLISCIKSNEYIDQECTYRLKKSNKY